MRRSLSCFSYVVFVALDSSAIERFIVASVYQPSEVSTDMYDAHSSGRYIHTKPIQSLASRYKQSANGTGGALLHGYTSGTRAARSIRKISPFQPLD
ncbi:hypothetical protein BC835DRAFT_1388084 [Cytidiella melzeri]|nr:hypothetical protein BC835DRAFT_1388084 [Cytidiella melzeri]